MLPVMDELSTTVDVIEELGGTSAVASLTGRTYNAAFNWRSFSRFPSNTYIVMSRELQRRGKQAPASLWGMVEPEKVSA